MEKNLLYWHDKPNEPTKKGPLSFVLFEVALAMWLRPLPAVRDLTHYGRWSTYNVSVLKLYNVSSRGRCARTGHPLKLPSPKKLARPGHFPPASQAGRLAGPVFNEYVFSMAGATLLCTLWLVARRGRRGDGGSGMSASC
jgi:hypothetical protein